MGDSQLNVISTAQLALELLQRCYDGKLPIDEESFKTVLTQRVSIETLLQFYATAGNFCITVDKQGRICAVPYFNPGVGVTHVQD